MYVESSSNSRHMSSELAMRKAIAIEFKPSLFSFNFKFIK